MAAFILIILLLLIIVFGLMMLLSFPTPDDGDTYIDDGIDHCKDCEICSKEHCKRCVFNRYNRK